MDEHPSYHVTYSMTRYVSLEKVSRSRIHRHSFYEPCIVISGSGEFEHDSQVYPLQEGDLFIANPDTYHEIRSSRRRDLTLYFLCFCITKHSAKLRTQPQVPLSQRSLANFLINHHIHLPSQSHMVPLFEHAMKLMRQDGEYPKNRFYHEATLLLVSQILAALTDMASSSDAEYSEHLHRNRIVEFIEQRLHQPLRIAEIAQTCGMSERNLRRKWNNWSTHTLSDEINRRRIERACQLLLLRDISIADVGYQVGICDPAQFSRVFKKIKKCSPGAFRSQHLDNVPGVLSTHRPFQTEYLEGGTKEHSS
jgi:AraC-like DNA-binding protein